MYDNNKVNRGEIKYPDCANQLISFKNIQRRRHITPTDIDGVIDYNGRAFIYLEAKYIGAPMPDGQFLSLQHLVDSHNKANTPAIFIIFEHDDLPHVAVDAGNKYVRSIYYKQLDDYTVKTKKTKVSEAIIAFEEHCEKVLKIYL